MIKRLQANTSSLLSRRTMLRLSPTASRPSPSSSSLLLKSPTTTTITQAPFRLQAASEDMQSTSTAPPPPGGGLAAGAVAVAIAAFALGRVLTGDVTLSTLAKESVPLEQALKNGKPTLIEFYADWCEVCKGLVKDEIKVERKYSSDVNFVMLNIDNSKWQEEMDEYHVSGVPHFIFMDAKATPMAAAVGKIPMEILESNVEAMSKGKPLPYLAPPPSETSDLDLAKAVTKSQASPRDHSSSSSSSSSSTSVATTPAPAVSSKAFYDFQVKDIDGAPFQLDAFKGKVVLVVNLASACGFTPQYEELQSLYDKLGPQGFVVAGFPCNQFGGQESGSNEDIKRFAKGKYGVTFPLFSKVNVNGPSADPLFDYLKAQKGGEDVKWNFTKFLVDKEGRVVGRYPTTIPPLKIEADIVKLLQ